jgi:hypothetical protein
VIAKYGVMSLTTDRVHTGTQSVVSLHQRNVANGGIGITKICATSSAVEMHAIGLTTGARRVSALSKNDVMRGTMTIIVPFMTNLTDSATHEESKDFSMI